MIQSRTVKSSNIEGISGINKKTSPFDSNNSREFVTGKQFQIMNPVEKVYSIFIHIEKLLLL